MICGFENLQRVLYLGTKRKFINDDSRRQPCQIASVCKYGNFVTASVEPTPSNESSDILTTDLEIESIKGILSKYKWKVGNG